MDGNNPTPRELAFGTPAGFLAFGFGSGLAPVAPGTFGTMAAVPFAVALKLLPVALYWPVLLLLFLAGIRLCTLTARRLGQHDPGSIVWDEMVGYWLAVAFVPLHWAWMLAAFVAFRFFDIVKPWPIRWAEKRWDHGAGIMLDDVIAALYAIVSLELLALLPGIP